MYPRSGSKLYEWRERSIMIEAYDKLRELEAFIFPSRTNVGNAGQV